METGLKQYDIPYNIQYSAGVITAIIETNKWVKIQENAKITIAAHADVIMILNESKVNLKMTTLGLIKYGFNDYK